ncbi:MAG: regulatory protein RecX [Candidatus Omnitrophica bacterium]|nr:regulatory protein RecX [Candidatus Omnitrophota bacterium]
MSDENELRKAKFYILRLFNLRPRSEDELRKRLTERGFTKETIDNVIADFSKKGLVNDAKFSKLWVDSRMSSRPKGAAVLKHELRAKGIDEQTIEATLQEVKAGYNEYEVVKGLADERMQQLAGLDKASQKRRLFGFLKRRGFDFDVVMKVVNESVKAG